MTYRTEFPSFDPATMPDIPADWKDVSWSRDACQSFQARIEEGEYRLYVFVDFMRPQDREFQDMPRFNVQIECDTPRNGDVVFESNDWSAVLAFVRDWKSE